MNRLLSFPAVLVLFGLGFITLLVCKLAGWIHLGWWWVFSPLIAAVSILVAAYLVFIIVMWRAE